VKRLLLATIFVLAAASAASAADVGVSVSVGQPGFYGRIDIGSFPHPEVIYPKPVVIRPAPAHVVYEPLYLRVPPGHQKKWSKHCSKYNACNRPVYFVKDKWYNDVYVPQHRAHPDQYRNHDQKHDWHRDGKQYSKEDKHGGKKDKGKKDKHGDKQEGKQNGKHDGRGDKH
jgi:hypothetical protein